MGNPAYSEQYIAANAPDEAAQATLPIVLSDEFEIYEHHGARVAVRSALKGTHRDLCLCYDCESFAPAEEGQASGCPIANAVYENAVKYDLVSPVLECPQFKESVVAGSKYRPEGSVERTPLGILTPVTINRAIQGMLGALLNAEVVATSAVRCADPDNCCGNPEACVSDVSITSAEGCCGGGCSEGPPEATCMGDPAFCEVGVACPNQGACDPESPIGVAYDGVNYEDADED
jgi:hypothetical protein